MIIDDRIVQQYLSGENIESYKDCWIYNSGNKYVFETPKASEHIWVSQLCDKLKSQIKAFEPRNVELVRKLFPDFDNVTKDYTIMLVVGFPDPYDAMVLNHNGKEYMVFDLIQFGKEALDESYNCNRVLTHELIHMCLYNKYPLVEGLSYLDELNYITFDEGFAHALSYPEDITSFKFDMFLEEKYVIAKEKLKEALGETNFIKKKANRVSANSGQYWDKFASISGKLYLLKHIDEIFELYESGWRDFAKKIVNEDI
jgi:hypothetical protein